jgi:transmembrane sensor
VARGQPAKPCDLSATEAAWNRTERLAALNSAAPETSVLPKEKSRHAFSLLLASVFVFVGLAAAGAAWYAIQPSDTVYTTPVGVHETISLADGSQIELNTDSILRARTDGNERMAMLEKGEAFFKIKHEVAHPFVVFASGHRVTDIGTKFLIRESDNQIEVAVLEGSAKLESGARSAVLKAGEMALAGNQTLIVKKRSVQEIADAVAWQRGMLVFSQTPLVEVASELNRYNVRKLVIADSTVAKDRIGGTFPTTGVDEVTAAARLLFGLRVDDHGNEIVISR